MNIDMYKVDSSNIDSIGYDPSGKVLRVSFKRSGVYEYDNVPQEVVGNLLRAESVGKAFNATVKSNYPFRKVA